MRSLPAYKDAVLARINMRIASKAGVKRADDRAVYFREQLSAFGLWTWGSLPRDIRMALTTVL